MVDPFNILGSWSFIKDLLNRLRGKNPKLDVNVQLAELHKHGSIYELNLVYFVSNKGNTNTTIIDIDYWFLEPINKGMPKVVEGTYTHRAQVYTLKNEPINIIPNETKKIEDFIPSHPLAEKAKLEFRIRHTHGITKIRKNLQIGFK